ncbi:hypothetical protein [Streptomyces sp. NPDC002602]|uniref:hypothetical protein n=1 Tax=Streptomyces sp. NPDC002602 TaxID=3364654 RepID=UPI0036919F9C
MDRGAVRLDLRFKRHLDTALVRPELVAEISADTAIDRGGAYRNPLRFKRLRLDVTTAGVPGFGEGTAAAAG